MLNEALNMKFHGAVAAMPRPTLRASPGRTPARGEIFHRRDLEARPSFAGIADAGSTHARRGR